MASDSLTKARTWLLGSAALLIAVGIVMIYSASAIYAYENMKDSAYFLKRHLLYLGAGGILARLAYRVDTAFLRKHAKRILGVLIVLLVLVLIPHVGSLANGARRWFKIFGFSLQPSEFLKLALIFYLADFLDRRKEHLADVRHTLLPVFFAVGISAGLILKQPDLGTAVTVCGVAMILFFLAGIRARYLLPVIFLAVPVLLFEIFKKSYRRKRILAFLHPWDTARDAGYHITQSFIALGSGGLFGVGLGSSQQKLFYLPASHTDFIFSIIGEELGFLGASAVVVLFIVFLFSGMVIVFRSRHFYLQLVGAGLVSLIGLEATVNIGVTIGALPTKGLSLPFISYGGSALWVNMMALGFLLNIGKQAMQEEMAGSA